MADRRRADQLLVERGLFASRAQAQAAIAAGLVTADAVVVTKPSTEIPIDAALRHRRIPGSRAAASNSRLHLCSRE
jgi:predicted rRNA methylase YqxC with S4 and FtsJ domains